MRQMTEAQDPTTAGETVLVAFVAGGYEPCRTLRASLASMADDLHGRVVVREIDVTVDAALAARHAVQVVPTLVLFDAGGQVVHRFAGVRPASQLRRELDGVLPPAPVPVAARRERRFRWAPAAADVAAVHRPRLAPVS